MVTNTFSLKMQISHVVHVQQMSYFMVHVNVCSVIRRSGHVKLLAL